MLAAALEAEAAAYVAQFADERDEGGHRLVVRNGRAEPRVVMTSAGAVDVHAPRVNDKRVDEATGCAPWCSPSVTARLVLGRAARGVPRHRRAALLVPQVGECACRAA